MWYGGRKVKRRLDPFLTPFSFDDAFADVTAKICAGLTKKVREIEDKFWAEDAVLYGQN